MKKCTPRILFEAQQCCITQCTSCKQIALHFQNILVNFTLKEFKSFQEIIGRVDFDKSCLHLSDEPSRIIIKTCHANIRFTFNKEEFVLFQAAIQQTRLILDAESILGQ